jgi:GrpB-like predicted nucleotidyltransferase (UPF0157 family)
MERMGDDIIIEPANPAWPDMFEAEKANLLAALRERFVAIEHIGSTAVAALDAKPVIDMMGGVRSMAEADALLEPLCGLGWDTSAEFNATLADRRFLLRWPEGVRTHHLHLVVYVSETWQRTLQFRNALRADAVLAQQYLKLKHELADKHRDDREAYTEAKTAFITKVLSGEWC